MVSKRNWCWKDKGKGGAWGLSMHTGRNRISKRGRGWVWCWFTGSSDLIPKQLPKSMTGAQSVSGQVLWLGATLKGLTEAGVWSGWLAWQCYRWELAHGGEWTTWSWGLMSDEWAGEWACWDSTKSGAGCTITNIYYQDVEWGTFLIESEPKFKV